MLHNPNEFISDEMKNVSEVYRVEILLAYFLNQTEQLVTPNQLMEIATSDNLVNYFSYTEAINQMLTVGTVEIVEIEGTAYYKLTEKGIKGAEDFKFHVSKSFRDRIYASGLKLFAKLKNERDITFDITQTDNGYEVHCSCKEGDLVLMDITLFAPDIEQANYIKSKINMNPTDFYCRVVDYVIDNEEYVPDLSDNLI